jgi:hypothetical protein
VPFGVRQKALVLKTGAEPSRLLAELSGVVIAEVRTPAEELVAVENVLKAEGRQVVGKSGAWLKVATVGQDGDGHFLLRVAVRHPADVQANRSPRPIGADPGVMEEMMGLVVTDAAGRRFGLTCQETDSTASGQWYIHQFTLTCRPTEKGQGDPARIAFLASRPTILTVPFTLTNVALP